MSKDEERRKQEEQEEQDKIEDLEVPDGESADVKGGLRIKTVERDPTVAGQYAPGT